MARHSIPQYLVAPKKLRRLFQPGLGYTIRPFLPLFIVLGCEQIKTVFEELFKNTYSVVLKGGAEEPLYLPMACLPNGLPAYNELSYTLDYPASALHEIAHWCLADLEQLKLKDWGHWYQPDGRDEAQQHRFQQAEARVQALEWILSVAAGRPFRESSDNLSGVATDDEPFKDMIYAHVLGFCEQGLTGRAGQLFAAFSQARNEPLVLSTALFERETLT